MCECVSVRGDVFGQNENSSTRLFHTQTLVRVITDCIIGIKSVRWKLNEKEAKVDSVARLPVTFGTGGVWWEMVTESRQRKHNTLQHKSPCRRLLHRLMWKILKAFW